MANAEHLKVLKLGTNVWNLWRTENPGISPDLSNGDFSNTNLSFANFIDAKLSNADFRKSNLRHTNFTRSNLNNVAFREADLRNAELSEAELIDANLTGANLEGADFSKARIGWTAFTNNDLSRVKGLDSVIHSGPSGIGVDTIFRSSGNIPEAFLRGAGVPDEFVTYMRALTGKAIEFYSCFLSYSSADQAFAERLYTDLQNKGVRCWFAPEDLKIGSKIWSGIDNAIRLHDKLLLVLSKHSVSTHWVEQEVETALEKERDQGRSILLPIRLDDTVLDVNSGWPALIKNTRHIGDFTLWKKPDSYQKAFNRLIRDLKAEEAL